MKLFKLLILLFIKLSISLTPNWDFSKSTEDLLLDVNKYSYTLYENTWNKTITLTKNITKTGNTISEKNYLYIEGNEFEKEWEGIESFYYFGGDPIYICPTGKNYINKYSNKNFNEIKPGDTITNDWDLKCYYNWAHRLFTFHLNLFNPGKFYGYDFKRFYNLEVIKNGISDFVWVGNESISKLNGIVMDGDYIALYTVEIKIEDYNISGEVKKLIQICKRLNYIRGIFSNDNYLYWFSYNDSDFISGYSKEQIYYNTDISNIHLNINSTNPFEFINNISIKYIEFVNKTQYAYYEIEEGNNTYHGIIDIKKKCNII